MSDPAPDKENSVVKKLLNNLEDILEWLILECTCTTATKREALMALRGLIECRSLILRPLAAVEYPVILGRSTFQDDDEEPEVDEELNDVLEEDDQDEGADEDLDEDDQDADDDDNEDDADEEDDDQDDDQEPYVPPMKRLAPVSTPSFRAPAVSTKNQEPRTKNAPVVSPVPDIDTPLKSRIQTYLVASGPTKASVVADQLGVNYQTVYSCLHKNTDIFKKTGVGQFGLIRRG